VQDLIELIAARIDARNTGLFGSSVTAHYAQKLALSQLHKVQKGVSSVQPNIVT
jgi:hypothetical protein